MPAPEIRTTSGDIKPIPIPDSRRSSIFTLALEEEHGCLSQIVTCRQNLATERGKRFQTVRIWILCSVSLVAILIIAIIDVQHYTSEEFGGREIRDALRKWECLDPILHYLSLEGALDAHLRIVLSSFNSTSSSSASSTVLTPTSVQHTPTTITEISSTCLSMQTFTGSYHASSLTTVLLDQLHSHYNYTDEAIADSRVKSLLSDSAFIPEDFVNLILRHRNATVDNITDYDPEFYKESRRTLLTLGDTEHASLAYVALVNARNYIAREMELASHCFECQPSKSVDDLGKTLTAVQESSNALLSFAADADTAVAESFTKIEPYSDLITEDLYSTRLALLTTCNTTDLQRYLAFDSYFYNMSQILAKLRVISDESLRTSMHSAEARVESIRARLAVEIVASLCVIMFFPLVLHSVSNMTGWIHDYAHRLRDRTDELKREKRMTESLLYQLLPRRVADQIRANQQVCAESFDGVTIFFSDIVGFTRISASVSPIEVIVMLNDLYSCFDSRIDVYDVYKVETIGDAYMVVSGCPERNGDKHVGEIATMSIDLRSAVKQVCVPRSPSIKLQCRIGIHTGPCVAGVVGIKMPRYCLFGDTVNTASRMESNGLPNKIHLSPATYEALCSDTTYVIEERGEVEIKGKGLMTTYWLIARQDYSEVNDSAVCQWKPKRKKKKVALETGFGSQDGGGTTTENSSGTVNSVNSTVSVQGIIKENNNDEPETRNGVPTLLKTPLPGQILHTGDNHDNIPGPLNNATNNALSV